MEEWEFLVKRLRETALWQLGEIENGENYSLGTAAQAAKTAFDIHVGIQRFKQLGINFEDTTIAMIEAERELEVETEH